LIKNIDNNESVISNLSNELITSIDEFNFNRKPNYNRKSEVRKYSNEKFEFDLNEFNNSHNNLEESLIRDSFNSADLDLKNVNNNNSFNIEINFKSPNKRRNSEYHEFKYGIKSNIGKKLIIKDKNDKDLMLINGEIIRYISYNSCKYLEDKDLEGINKTLCIKDLIILDDENSSIESCQNLNLSLSYNYLGNFRLPSIITKNAPEGLLLILIFLLIFIIIYSI
jgi:hypothetical protein